MSGRLQKSDLGKGSDTPGCRDALSPESGESASRHSGVSDPFSRCLFCNRPDTPGTARARPQDDEEFTATLDDPGGGAGVEGKVLKITVPNPLAQGQNYSVSIEKGFVKDQGQGFFFVRH